VFADLLTFPETDTLLLVGLFTLGLSLSSSVDILIACLLCYFLLKGRQQSPKLVPCCPLVAWSSLTTYISMHHVIDSLILYTFETGALTWLVRDMGVIFQTPHLLSLSSATIISMICVRIWRLLISVEFIFIETSDSGCSCPIT